MISRSSTCRIRRDHQRGSFFSPPLPSGERGRGEGGPGQRREVNYMYSLVLAAMLTTGEVTPNSCRGCWGCYGCCGCYSCRGCYGCYGCYGGCHGCYSCSGCWGCC